MKNKILYTAGMLIFCLFVLYIPLNIMKLTIDSDKSKVKSISGKGSKEKIEFAVGKENYYTKLLLVSGKLKSDKEVVTGDQIPAEEKKKAFTIAELELNNLYRMGYYGTEILEKKYAFSIEEFHYSEQVFGKYTCDVWKIIFQNNTEKHTILLDAEDSTVYYLEMELNKDINSSPVYIDDSWEGVKKEIATYISPLGSGNTMITFGNGDSTNTVVSSVAKEKNIEKVEKAGDNEYHITEKGGTAYYARLESKDNYLRFELLP